MARFVVDVAAGRNADAAHLRRQCIGEVVAVQVHRRYHVKLARARDGLLKDDVGDHILDDDFAGGQRRLLFRVGCVFALGGFGVFPLVPCVHAPAKFTLGQSVAPRAERTLGVLHDVALVGKGHTVAPVVQCVADGCAHEALRALARNWLDAKTGSIRKADLAVLLRQMLLQQRLELNVAVRTLLQINAGVNVLGVLAKDHHVHIFRAFYRRRHAGEVAHGAQAHIQVQLFAQLHVQAANAAANGRGERALDAHFKFSEGSDGLIQQPCAKAVKALLAGVHLHPFDVALVVISLRHRSVDDAHGCSPDIRAGAIALNERHDRPAGHVQLAA